MSRCFSFPQHEYFSKIVANDALIDSIKLHGEAKMAAKSERKKQRKMEKTLKRQSKTEKKERKTLNQLGKRKRSDEKSHKLDFAKDDSLERSNITQEYEQPSSYQNQCASDSSENSNRRKRHATLESGIQANGNVLKIRLAQRNSNHPVELLEQLSSLNVNTIPSAPAAAPPIPIEQKCSTSGRKRSRAEDAIDNGFTSLDMEMKLVSLLYNDLVSNLAPLQESSSWLYESDDSWLFERKLSEKCKPKNEIPVSTNSCSSLWPKATYLPEVEIYALPYAIPF